MNRIEVSEHKRGAKYWFDPDTCTLVKQDPFNQPKDLPPYGTIARAACFRGIFKRFLFGGTLFFYRDDSNHYLQYKNYKLNLADPRLGLSRQWVGPVLIFSIKALQFKRNFYCWMLGAKIQKSVDVTYDYLDQTMDDFSFEIIEQYNKVRSKNT